jgi:hypothetical protein
MAQVDAAYERDVLVDPSRMPEHHQLLVVAARTFDPLVQQHLAAGLVHQLPQPPVLLLAEVRLVRVGAPQQPTDLDTAAGEVDQDPADLGARAVQELIGVAAPVGEVHPVAGLQPLERPEQAREIAAAMDQRIDLVAFGPGAAVAAAPVELRGRVAALRDGQEPIVRHHRLLVARCHAIRGTQAQPAGKRVPGPTGRGRTVVRA